MEESEIAKALQADLSTFQVKLQVKRKESQLHILVTRPESSEVDYPRLLVVVKQGLEKLPLPDVEDFVLYGRVAGAKQREWQDSATLTPALPTIELDLEDGLTLDDLPDDLPLLGEVLSVNEPLLAEDTQIQANVSRVEVPTYTEAMPLPDVSFADLPNLPDSLADVIATAPPPIPDLSEPLPSALSETPLSEISLPEISLPEIQVGNLEPLTPQNAEKDATDQDAIDRAVANLPPLTDLGAWEEMAMGTENMMPATDPATHPATDPAIHPATDPTTDPAASAAGMLSGLGEERLNRLRNREKQEDFHADVARAQVTPEPSVSLPPPPRMSSTPPVFLPPEDEGTSATTTAGWLFPIIGLSALAICIGVGGYVFWDRKVQAEKVDAAKEAIANIPDPKQLKPEAKIEARDQLQEAIAKLESIPDRVWLPYTEAQSELPALRDKLAALGQEVPDAEKLTKAKDLAKRAAILVQGLPHKSSIWLEAQSNWQESLDLLEAIPNTAPTYAEAQAKLKDYRANFAQITRQLQRQQLVEAAIAKLPPTTQSQLTQLKAQKPQKTEFVPICAPKLRPFFNLQEVKKQGFASVPALADFACEFLLKTL